MGAENHRVLAAQFLDQATRFDDLLRVEAGCRLVEDQHVRVVEQGLGEADSLPVALRELCALAVGHVRYTRPLHGRLYPGRAIGSRDAFDPGAEHQVIAHGHVRVERRRLGQVAGAALGLDGLLDHVVAGDEGFAVGRRHIAGDDPHRRRLAGAVGAEEAQNLPTLGLEADVVYGREGAVLLGEVLNFDHRSFSSIKPVINRAWPLPAGTTRDTNQCSPLGQANVLTYEQLFICQLLTRIPLTA